MVTPMDRVHLVNMLGTTFKGSIIKNIIHVTCHKHLKFVAHVNMIIPDSESLNDKKYSPLFVSTVRYFKH
jgi:hypothetical protein